LEEENLMASAAVFSRQIPEMEEPATNSQLSGVVLLYHATSALLISLRRIGELKRLPDDWDSYGSPRIQQLAAQRAVQVLSAAAIEGVRPPQIVPVSGGGLQIEWTSANRELEIEILPDGSIEYLIVEAEQTYEGPMPAEHADLFVQGLVRWLTGTNAYAGPIR
jgi:hypothetical protein